MRKNGSCCCVVHWGEDTPTVAARRPPLCPPNGLRTRRKSRQRHDAADPWEGDLQHIDIILAALGALALGWIADLLTGGRGVAKTLLASGAGALCGWFLAVRVFGAHAMGDVRWVVWAMAGSAVVLLVFFLTRNKR